jgi:hypothetical protein
MSSRELAFLIAAAIFAGGVAGLLLQRILPEKHTTGASRDMFGAVVGLLTLLSALTLGLLIWTAYGVYAGQNIAIQGMAAKVLQLDLALADYGPDANPLRLQLRDSLGKTIDEIWAADQTDVNFVANNFAAALRNLRVRDAALDKLKPATDQQTQAIAVAKATADAISQGRLQMSFALSAPISYPLLFTVVGWGVFLFLGYGLMSKFSVASVVAVIVGAIAVGSAALMILDLSSPYAGVFRASPAPLEQVLAIMGKE